MDAKKLGQMGYLSREIHSMESRIKAVENRIANEKYKNDGIKDKLTLLMNELRIKKKKRVEELFSLEEYINGIDDSLMRLILSLRYVSRLSWQQIAFKIGHYDEQYPRKKHNRFLEKQQMDKSKVQCS